MWVIMLLRDEFDADERAEVGGGDRLGETELGLVAVNLGEAMFTPSEKRREQVVPVGLKHRRYFVGNHSEKKMRGGS